MSPAGMSASNIELREEWCRQGEDLLRALMGLLQTVKIHQSNNKLVTQGVETLRQTVTVLCKEDDQVSLIIAHGRFFLNEEKFPHRPMIETLIHTFQTYCLKRHLQGITLQMTINETGDHRIIEGARLLNKAELEDEPEILLGRHLDQGNLPWLDLVFEEDGELTEEHYDNPSDLSHIVDPINKTGQESSIANSQPKSGSTGGSAASILNQGNVVDESKAKINSGYFSEDESKTSTGIATKQRAASSYCSALASIKEVAEKIYSQQRVGVRRSVRLIQNMVDLLIDKEPLFLAMSTIRVFDDYTFTHSVNVAILSMCLGKRLDLSKTLLNRLGLCGLFHDLGKVEIPKEILNKKGKLTEPELTIMRSHPLKSVQQILKLRASQEMKAQIILPPFEHHLRYDLSGYPQLKWQKPVSLFGRIITIADVFDAITSPRVYRPTALSQDKALGYMLEGSGTDFDPLLLKVFINMMGVYPVGTLLELDTGELGLVVETPDDAEEGRPLVTLLEQNDHGRYVKGKTVNLNTRGKEAGKFLRNINKTHHPSTYDIQPAAFII